MPPSERRRRARREADAYDGVLSRRVLRALGVDRNAVAREVAAERWASHGTQTIAVHTGTLGLQARRWRAVWEVGEGIAAVDGVTALQAAGLTGYVDDDIHVSVVHTCEIGPVEGARIHKVIRRVEGELAGVGLPRTRPAVAAIRAAHWAATDRQAALILAMAVQQRLITGRQLVEAEALVRGRNRRRFIHLVAHDIADGAHSLGELDFVAACRRRGLPDPDRQVVRRLPGGTAYLDVRWDTAGLVVEIDGSGHVMGLQMVDDDLRQNAVTLGHDLVLRVNLLGWRLHPNRYLDQVHAAYHRRTSSGGRWVA